MRDGFCRLAIAVSVTSLRAYSILVMGDDPDEIIIAGDMKTKPFESVVVYTMSILCLPYSGNSRDLS